MCLCFHCRDIGKCDCISCRDELTNKLGRCAVCKAREVWDVLRPMLDAQGIDTREARYWRFERPEAPAKPHKIFLPEEQFLKAMAERKKKSA